MGHRADRQQTSARRLGSGGNRRHPQAAQSEQGYSLPLVLAAALILIAGSAVLANRSSMGLLSSVFQNQSWEAKEAAEIGMTQIISELNKERNRYLMVSRTSAAGANNDPGLWTNGNDVYKQAARTNPCSGASPPDYSNLDARVSTSTDSPADTSYGTWYIQDSGEITRTKGSASRGFKLLADGLSRQTLSTSGSPFNLYRNRPNGTGKLTLVVQGFTYRGSTAVASAKLEKEFELVPKCCRVSFGAAHGGLDYGISATTNESICLSSASSLGLGLIAGAGLEGGSMRLIGATTVKDGTTTSAQNVSPVICIVAPGTTCTDSTNNNSNTELAKLDLTLPPVKTYSDAFNAAGAIKTTTATVNARGTLQDCSATTAGSGKGRTDASNCPSNSSGTQTETNTTNRLNNFTYCADAALSDCSITVINGGVSSSNLPDYCVINAANTELHCNVSELTYNNMVFASGSRRIFLYFPDADPSSNNYVIEPRTGSSTIQHCTSPSQLTSASIASGCTSASGKDIVRVSMFGCATNTCSGQTVKLRGSGNSVGMFSYFPEGALELNGTPTYEGVMWAKTVNAVGTSNFVIPASGLTSVFQMMGLILNDEASGSTSFGTIGYDFIARATNRYRWL